ncbi:hypothetical protein ALP75_200822 [Pseudomonas syringae pv. actinidiae]|nr:hypothetical protein ALP75_200822 [Pseudomonas syringae pv. actinidiae]
MHRCLIGGRCAGEDEVGRAEFVEQIAFQGDLETITGGVNRIGLDVGFAAIAVQRQVNSVRAAVAQPAQANGGEVNAVFGDVEVNDGVALLRPASGVIAVAVQTRAVDENVGACAPGQCVGIGTAIDRVCPRAAIDAVHAGIAVDDIVACRTGQGIATCGAFRHALEDEVTGIECVFQVAGQAQLEPVAAGIHVQRLDIGAVQGGVVADIQRAVFAAAQPGEAQVRQIDAVLADIEISEQIGSAGGRRAIAVGQLIEAKGIGTRAAAEFVGPGTADQNVVARAAVERVFARQTEDQLVCRTAGNNVVGLCAQHGDQRERIARKAAIAVNQRQAFTGMADGIADDAVAVGAVFVALGHAIGGIVAAGDQVATDQVVTAVEVLAGDTSGVVVGLNDDLRHRSAEGVVAQRVIKDIHPGTAINTHARAAVVVNVQAADRHLTGQLDQHAFGTVAIDRTAGDGDVGGRGNVLAAALHHNAGAAVAVGDVVAQGEIVGAGHHVEAVTIVVIRNVVLEHAVAQVIGHEAIQAVAVGHAVLDHHVDGLLVRVEPVARAILDFDAVQGDVRILAVRARNVPVEPAVHLAGGGVPITVQRQVLHAEVVGFFTVGRADNAGDFGVRAVRELDDRLAHAGT